MTDSIISINVGGQIFMTQISTLTKYPESLLGVMFNHEDQGMAPMPKTKEGHYFLDVNPLYFGEILDYLRLGKTTTNDKTLLSGVKNLAEYLGLTKLVHELEPKSEESWVTLDLDGKRKIQISRKILTKYESSTIAKYFLGDEDAITGSKILLFDYKLGKHISPYWSKWSKARRREV